MDIQTPNKDQADQKPGPTSGPKDEPPVVTLIPRPAPEKKSNVPRVIAFVVIAGVIFGGLHFYFGYAAKQKHNDFFILQRDQMREKIQNSARPPTVQSVHKVLLDLATQAGCTFDQLKIIAEPFGGSRYVSKMRAFEATQAVASKAEWLVGFQGKLRATKGWVTKILDVDGYTYQHDFAAPQKAASR